MEMSRAGESADPRVARTRRLLEDALAALLDRRPYSEITVKDVAAEAGVNRATFYAHFVDKDDLFRTFLRHAFDRAVAGRAGEGAAYLDVLLSAVLEHADWLTGKCRSARTGRGVPPPEGEMQAQLEGELLRWLEGSHGELGAEERATAALAVGAMVASVATRWGRRLQRPPMPVVAAQLRRMVTAAVAAAGAGGPG